MLNKKRNAKKVNKEQIKIRKIYSNVGYCSLKFVYMLMHTQNLNEKQKVKTKYTC